MTLLPMVERELRMAARRGGTYWNRLLTPAALGALLVGKVMLRPLATGFAPSGLEVFETVSAMAFVLCVVEGVWKTSDCLSMERREGTLGLLFLTDLKGHDVVLGKMSAAWLASSFSLLAMVPVLGWSLFLGGVTFGEIWRMAIALGDLLFFSLAVGVWVSSRSRSANRAMAGTFCAALLILLAPGVASFLMPLSPAYSCLIAPDAQYKVHPSGYWASLLFTQIFGWGLLWLAAKNVMHYREEMEAMDSQVPGRTSGLQLASVSGRQRAKLREKLLGVNPVLWLAGYNLGGRGVIWWLVGFAGLAVAVGMMPGLNRTYSSRAAAPVQAGHLVMGFVVLGVHCILRVLVAAQACRCLAEARRNSTLEVLLCAPLTVRDILEGQMLALKRRLLGPLLLLLVFEMTALAWFLNLSYGGRVGWFSGTDTFGSLFIFCEAAYAIYFVLDLQGVAWAGIWFGLCSRSERLATFKTVFYVMLLPLVLLLLYCFGWALLVAWPVIIFCWAKLRLQEHFRFFAGYRAGASGEMPARLVFGVPETAGEAQV